MALSSSQERLAAALVAMAGLLTLGVTVGFDMLPAVRAAEHCMPPDAVIRFEFARTAAELAPIFGQCPGPAIAAVDAVNRLDLALYIPAYSAFAALAAVFLGRAVRRPLVLAAIAAALGAAAADLVETTHLLRMTKDLAAAGPLLPVASSAAWMKFALLALNAVLLAVICFTGSPRRPILGGLLLLPAAGTVILAIDLSHSVWLNIGYFAAWTPVLALALWTTIPPKRA